MLIQARVFFLFLFLSHEDISAHITALSFYCLSIPPYVTLGTFIFWNIFITTTSTTSGAKFWQDRGPVCGASDEEATRSCEGRTKDTLKEPNVD